ncbi:Uma2 family endonuclease [Streptomyces laurentii]|uniref:Uma2 family endonuclease n=1 Tax=Streptomyces laurentii TaxID=39478 RepID=UPI0036929E0F
MPGGPRHYPALRRAVNRLDYAIPGRFEITKTGIVHDLPSPNRPHELTVARLRRHLGRALPANLLAHTGRPDVENTHLGILRRPDMMVIPWVDMEGEGAFDPRTLVAAIEVVSRSNPDNDWVGKLRDYPLLGIPTYAIFDPRTGSGAVFSDIHATPGGPRYATRKDFFYGEPVTIGAWTISTEDLPEYP